MAFLHRVLVSYTCLSLPPYFELLEITVMSHSSFASPSTVSGTEWEAFISVPCLMSD